MNNDIGNGMQWLQLIVIIVGFITILIKIGVKQGEQEEKNKNFGQNLKLQGKEIMSIKDDIGDIKEDVAYIKGKLL